MVENGTVILKFFLNISKKEQKKRFLARLTDPEKNWKFTSSDATDRDLWDKYMDAYQECLSATSTNEAPWYVIPADNKPFCRLAVGYIIAETLKNMDLHYPVVTEEQKKELVKARMLLEGEFTDSTKEEESEQVESSHDSPGVEVDVVPVGPQDLVLEPVKEKGKKDKLKSKNKTKKDKKNKQ